MDIEKAIWYRENAKWLGKELLPYDIWYNVIGFNPSIHRELTKILPRFGMRFWLIDIWSGKRYDAYMNSKQYQISSLTELYNNYPDTEIGEIMGVAINPENKDEVLVDFKYKDDDTRKLINEVKYNILKKELREDFENQKRTCYEKLRQEEYNILKKELREDFERQKREYYEKLKQEDIEKDGIIENFDKEKDAFSNKIKELEKKIIEDKENFDKEKDAFSNKIKELEKKIIEDKEKKGMSDIKEYVETNIIVETERHIMQMIESMAFDTEENKKIIRERIVVEKRAEEKEQKAITREKIAEEKEQKAITREKIAEEKERRSENAFRDCIKVMSDFRKMVDFPDQYKLSMLRHSLVGNRSTMEEIKKIYDDIGVPTVIEDFVVGKLKK